MDIMVGGQVRDDGGLVRVVVLELGQSGRKLKNPLRTSMAMDCGSHPCQAHHCPRVNETIKEKLHHTWLTFGNFRRSQGN